MTEIICYEVTWRTPKQTEHGHYYLQECAEFYLDKKEAERRKNFINTCLLVLNLRDKSEAQIFEKRLYVKLPGSEQQAIAEDEK